MVFQIEEAGSIPVQRSTNNFTMPKKQKIVFKKRAFLNDDISMAGFVIAVLPEFNYNEDGDRVSAYPTFDLGDCSTKISLDFSFYTKAQMKQVRKKLELLRLAVCGFTDAFDSEVKRFEEIEKDLPKTKKKKEKPTIREQIKQIEEMI